MNLKHFLIIFLGLQIACTPEPTTQNLKDPITVKYPESTKDESVSDNYHGTEVKDPYRWLEDDNSEATKSWVKAQNEVTFDYLDKIPFRETIRNRLVEVWNYERVSAPFKEGGKIYYFKNNGLQNQSILYTKAADGTESVVLDPNKFSDDGTSSLGAISFSADGKYFAYQVSEGGSDWRKIKVRNLETGEDLADEVDWVKFSSISWKDDGFYYSRYPKPDASAELSGRNTNHKLYYHKLGSGQSADQIIFEDAKNPNHGVFGSTTEDERFLALNIWESTSGNALYVYDLDGANKRIPIFTEITNDFNVIDNSGDKLLVMTNYKAKKNRVVAIDINNPAEENWEEIIPETDDKLSSVSMIGGKIFANYIHNASSLVKVLDENGKYLQDLKLPGIGTVGGFRGKKKDSQGYFSFTSFTQPNTIYSLDAEKLATSIHKAPETPFRSEDYVTEQVWYTSKDGTKVPMFITHKKGLKKDGTNTTLLYGYGGFDISILPAFSPKRTALLENGGIYAVANIRGGGEFGKAWHEAGTKERKQNVFDDFAAAAEYLIDQKYTSSAHLGIEGRSNGGLLVGASMTQRPDLFAVAFPGVGVLDMLRYDQFTIGRAWSSDYGLSENPEEFKYLYAYSPLHNLKQRSYPATMITTADHDDRVVPAHSFKFAARLQEMQQGENPTLIRIETSAGHGAGKPVDKQIDEAADEAAFLFYNTGKTIKVKPSKS